MAEDEPGQSRSIPAHKILLAAGSTFFQRMFQSPTGGKMATVFFGEINFKLVGLYFCILKWLYFANMNSKHDSFINFNDLKWISRTVMVVYC